MRIGIIGGSIAGCSAAIALSRAGHEVVVFERSASELKGRGAGIATSSNVLQSLKDDNFLDADIPSFHVEALHHAQFIHDLRRNLGISGPVHVCQQVHFCFFGGPSSSFIIVKQGGRFGKSFMDEFGFCELLCYNIYVYYFPIS